VARVVRACVGLFVWVNSMITDNMLWSLWRAGRTSPGWILGDSVRTQDSEHGTDRGGDLGGVRRDVYVWVLPNR